MTGYSYCRETNVLVLKLSLGVKQDASVNLCLSFRRLLRSDKDAGFQASLIRKPFFLGHVNRD